MSNRILSYSSGAKLFFTDNINISMSQVINIVPQQKIISATNPREFHFMISVYLNLSFTIQPTVQPLKKSEVNVAFTIPNR